MSKKKKEYQPSLWTTSASEVDPLKPGARKLAGSKPARTDRDPTRIKRTRKVRLRG